MHPHPEHTWRIDAIKYATADRDPASSFVGTPPPDAPRTMDYFVWLLRRESDNEIVVVDTGFDATQAAQRGRTITHTVAEGLEALGVDHHAVRNVITTHLHYDHAGNVDLFPQATFHLQGAELRYATGAGMRHPFLGSHMNVPDVLEMIRRLYAGRLTLHEGDSSILPGITVHRVGGHTGGSQLVRVDTRRGAVLLVSDASHYYANYRDRNPFPVLADAQAMLDGYERFYALADSAEHIIPGHDPAVIDRYPPSDLTMLGWACRLDAQPTAEAPTTPMEDK